jgi:uncharacterized membrane protein YwzB
MNTLMFILLVIVICYVVSTVVVEIREYSDKRRK